jgi:hypothetical protein
MRLRGNHILKFILLSSQTTHGVRPCKTKGDSTNTWGDNL